MTQVANLPENTYEADAELLFSDRGGSFVYLLLCGEKVIYVGQTLSLLSRIGSHRKTIEFTSVRIMYVPHCMRLRVESDLIALLRPTRNHTFRIPVIGDATIDYGLKPEPAIATAKIRRKAIALVDVEIIEIRRVRGNGKGRCAICGGETGGPYARLFVREGGHNLCVVSCDQCTDQIDQFLPAAGS